MNLSALGKALTVSVSVALILFGLSGFLVQRGVTGAQFLSDVWRLLALGIGLSIVWAFAYPHVRGIKKGDSMVALFRREGGVRAALLDVLFVTALEDGRVGERIKIVYGNGVHAEGQITSYGGTFSPATVKITETERLA
ncbi:hypothetical protein HY572_01720 [Candidatus Micrarchaeota archaeon]|nr:hypothetical protein [Candidatus Micrarchaeota archaeon]